VGTHLRRPIARLSGHAARVDRQLVWAFQSVHHDLWDYDLPSGPSLIEVERGRRHIAALAQASKQGHLFILDRDTGQPVLPV